MAEIRIEGLFKWFGDVAAVRDLHLDIRDGEFMVLVGPSGCGKTTTLRMVAGLESVSRGDIRIDGRVVNDVEPKDRDVAMVFQSYALYPHMTVRDNMAFGLRMRRVKRDEIERRVREAAAILGIEPLLDRRPRALSGGQRQRVALGRAIVRHPAVFLMDEPLSNLDAKLRAQTRTEIVRLQKRLGTTTIFVTHDQVEAMTMGDRIAVMRDGVLQQVASPRDLYHRPANRVVAEFIGSHSINTLEAEVRVEEGRAAAVGAGFRLDLARRFGEAASLPGKVVIGVRPESLRLMPAGADGSSAGAGPVLSEAAEVELVEPLGAETYVHVATADGTRLTGREEADTPFKAGDRVSVAIIGERFHVFDGETGATLDPEARLAG